MGRDCRKTRQSGGWDRDRSGSDYFPTETQVQCFHTSTTTRRPGGIPAAQQPWPHPFSSLTLSNAISSPGFLHPLSEPTLEELRLGTKRTETEGTQRVRTTQSVPSPSEGFLDHPVLLGPCGQNCVSYRVNSRRDRMCTHTQLKVKIKVRSPGRGEFGVEKRKLGR